MSIHQLKAQEPIRDMTPAQFFNELVPQILHVQRGACQTLGGTYAIQLFGDQGGAWTLDFPNASIESGARDDVDLYVEMSAADFQGLMKGTLDIPAAARAGRVRVEGNPQLFLNLAAILQPAE